MAHLRGLVVAAVAVSSLTICAHHRAHAGTTKAWTAAKGAMPDTAALVVGLDVATLEKTVTFEKMFPVLTSKKPDFKSALEMIKSTCKIDPLAIVKSAVVALDDKLADAAVYINVTGFDASKLESCLRAGASEKSADPKTVSIKMDHNVTDFYDGDQHVYFGWIGADVLVINPSHMQDKAALKPWMGGGFAKSALAKVMAKVNTGAAMFVGSTIVKQMDENATMKQGYGSVSFVTGKVTVDAHVDYGTPDAAKNLAEMVNKQITDMRANPPIPVLGEILKGVTVAATGSELAAKANVVEKDLVDMLGVVLAAL